MSIHQLNIYGMDMVEVAIKRLQTFEPEEGYFLAFSGGKDSVVVKALADMAKVKYDAHYAITSVDPPELVQFVKTFPDVIRERQYWKKDGLYHKAGDPITMWNLIPEKKMPPTRIVRYCCQVLKETQTPNRVAILGVRSDESSKRKGRDIFGVRGGHTAKLHFFHLNILPRYTEKHLKKNKSLTGQYGIVPSLRSCVTVMIQLFPRFMNGVIPMFGIT